MNRWQVLIDLIRTNGYRKVAQIGVHHGKTVRHVIEACELDEYVWVDPVISEDLDRYVGELNRLDILSVRYLITTSETAAILVDNNSLDLVFIDALHDYENVKADIQTWYWKIRFGGILCGDDYGQTHCEGVKQAVDEVFGESIELIPIGRKGVTIWVVRK